MSLTCIQSTSPSALPHRNQFANFHRVSYKDLLKDRTHREYKTAAFESAPSSPSYSVKPALVNTMRNSQAIIISILDAHRKIPRRSHQTGEKVTRDYHKMVDMFAGNCNIYTGTNPELGNPVQGDWDPLCY